MCVHLIYKNKSFEGHYKDYEFSKDKMKEHWASGLGRHSHFLLSSRVVRYSQPVKSALSVTTCIDTGRVRNRDAANPVRLVSTRA